MMHVLRGQGAIEYLLIIAVAILIVSVVVTSLSVVITSGKSITSNDSTSNPLSGLQKMAESLPVHSTGLIIFAAGEKSCVEHVSGNKINPDMVITTVATCVVASDQLQNSCMHTQIYSDGCLTTFTSVHYVCNAGAVVTQQVYCANGCTQTSGKCAE